MSAAQAQTRVATDDSNPAESAAAVEVARRALIKELGVEAGSIEMLSATPQTWPNSSLGCGKPGAMAAQVISSGYEVLLSTAKGNYRVHTSQNSTVVCGLATQWRDDRKRVGTGGVGLPLKNMSTMTEKAREDLAKRLAISQTQIRTLSFTQTEWADSSMECAVAGEPINKQATKGYRLALRAAGRIYTYHTDMQRVRACPAIESN